VPQPDDRGIPLAPFAGQVIERGPRGGSVHRGVDGLDAALEGVPVPLGGQPERVADQVNVMPTSA
jgi:hypothetical protein